MSYTREQIDETCSLAEFYLLQSTDIELKMCAMLRQLLAECDAAVAAKDKAEQQLAQYVDALDGSVKESNKLAEKLAAANAKVERMHSDVLFLCKHIDQFAASGHNPLCKEDSPCQTCRLCRLTRAAELAGGGK